MSRVEGWVWLDKSKLPSGQVVAIREALTLERKVQEEFAPDDPEALLLRVYEERPGEIGVPRSWYLEHVGDRGGEELCVSDAPETGPGFRPDAFLGETGGVYWEQNEAVERVVSAISKGPFGGGFLKASTAFGKTVVSLRIAAAMGRRTLVIVNRGFFMRQWRQRIQEFFPDARIGMVQQAKCQYKNKDIVIAMVHSLASRDYGEEFYDAFGLVITDEAHRISSKTWNPVIAKFHAPYRLGLTATPRRKDGTQDAFFWQIGPIVFSAKTETMIPEIHNYTLPYAPRPTGKYRTPESVPRPTQISQLALDVGSVDRIAGYVYQGVLRGRKVMVVSERTEQLWTVFQRVARRFASLGGEWTYGFATGSQYVLDDNGERVMVRRKKGRKTVEVCKTRSTSDADLDEVETKQVLFATRQMIEEGFDVSAIDVLIVASPIGDPEQTVGRARRFCLPKPSKCERMCPWRAATCQGKPTPVVLDPDFPNAPVLDRTKRGRVKFYQKIGAKRATTRKPVKLRKQNAASDGG